MSQSILTCTKPELNAINQLVNEVRNAILLADDTVKGFNIGTNAGEASGQTVFHCHVHLIPRRKGDTASPRGGVRGCNPQIDEAIDIALSNYFSVYKSIRLATVVQNQVQSTRQN